jgi:hypothetical protein
MFQRDIPRTLEGYARGRRLVAQEYMKDGEFEPPSRHRKSVSSSRNRLLKGQPNQASLRADPHLKNSAF